MLLFDVVMIWAFMNIGMIEESFFDYMEDGYYYYETPAPSYFVEYGVHAEVWKFEVFGGMQNTFYKSTGDKIIGGFMPIHDTYKIGAKFKLTDNLQVIGDYQCRHTVDPFGFTDEQQSYDASRGRIYAHINTRWE